MPEIKESPLDLPPSLALEYGLHEIRTKKDYFALLLVNRIYANYILKNYFTHYNTSTTEWEALIKVTYKVDIHLILHNTFFYPQGGSIFKDFKTLIDENVPENEDRLKDIRQQFSPIMDRKTIFNTAKQIIQEWMGDSELSEEKI